MNIRKVPVVALMVLAGASWSQAQENHGVIDIQGQSVRGETVSSKFDEYTDVHRGVYVERLGLDLGGTYYFLLDASKPGLKDQRVQIEAGRWGLHKLSLAYDQIPHNLSNTAQTFLKNEGNGTFTLPNKMQSDMQTSTANANSFLPNSPFVPLRVDRKKGSISYTYNPAGRWRVNLAYSGEKKEGEKAIGVTYGHGQLQEALEPVDYQTHNMSVNWEYVGKDVGWSAGYAFSSFSNGIKALTVDNPFQLANGALSASGSSTPGTARLALPPDNRTHEGNLAMNAKLSPKSRLSGVVSYSVQYQDDSFLPLTSNLKILKDPRLQAPPAGKLEGEVRTLSANAKWNWKPAEPVALDLYAKTYDVDNHTRSLLFKQYVPYDATFSTSAPRTNFNPTRSRESLPLDFNRSNLGAGLYYSVAKPLSVKLAYDWERMARRLREVDNTYEHKATVSCKLGPVAGLVVRPSYQYALRTIGDYNAERVAEETFPLGEGTSLGQMPELRKFDEAGRRRQKVEVRADWGPWDWFDAGVDYGLIEDRYDAAYGVLAGKTLYHSLDASLSPSDRWNLYADYTWENMTTNTRSRYRATGLDTASNDWVGLLQDTAQTFNVGASVILVPEAWDTEMGWTLAYSKGRQEAINPNALAGTASQKASARAVNFPNTYTRWHKARAALRYRGIKNVVAKLGYEYQQYDETDWAQDNLDAYQPVWNKSVFLGASQGRFDAHLLSLGMSYLF